MRPKAFWWALLWLLVSGIMPLTRSATAQDALDLPADLYILSNTGVITRVGVGQAGISTITPEDTFILDFAITPQGDWLAYRTEQNIRLTPLFETEQADFILDEAGADAPPIRGQGRTMAWSPDSSTLAYTTLFGIRVAFDAGGPFTQYSNIVINAIKHLVWSPEGTFLAAEADENIWWVYRRNGAEMTLSSAIPSSYGLAWLNDSQLLFTPPEGGLIMMDLNNANAQSLLTDTNRVYYEPFVRPDGTILAFSKLPDEADVPENAAFLQEMTLSDGLLTVQTTSETPTDLTNIFWGPAGELLVSLQEGAPALVLPTSNVFFTLPFADAIAIEWGGPQPETVTGLASGRAAFFLAPTTEGIVQVWRLPGDGLPAAPVTASLTDIERYAFSMNGRSLAYVSDGRLWVQALNTGDNTARELAVVENPMTDLAFDPAGQTIAYTITSTQADSGVWLVGINASDNPPQLVLPVAFTEGDSAAPVYDYRGVAFAPNVNALLVKRQTMEAVDYYVLDPVSDELSTVGGYDTAAWLRNGRVLGTSTDVTGSGIYTIDPSINPAEASIVLRTAALFVQDIAEISPGTLRVILIGSGRPGESGVILRDVEISTGAVQDITPLPPMIAPVLSPEGSIIAGYGQTGGTLLFYEIETGHTRLLTSPLDITSFQWAEFR